MKVEIFSIERENGWEHEFVLCLVDTVDEEEFLEVARVVRGTYAGRLMSRIYGDIFVRSKNLKTEFEQYFRIEYENFDHYLEKRLFLRPDERAPISTAAESSSAIMYYKPSQFFLYDDYGSKFLERLMKEKESA